MKKKLFAVGGDARQTTVVSCLRQAGCTVECAEHSPQGWTPEQIARLHAAEVVLLPLPAADKEGNLNAPERVEKMTLEDFFSLLRCGQTVLGGRFPPGAEQWGKKYGLFVVDYYCHEELMLQNAALTAEGALHLAMGRLKRSLRCLPCVVMGYGRIGTFLAKDLLSLGASVTVAARDAAERMRAELNGCKSVSTEDCVAALKGAALVVNTIPYPVLNAAELCMLPPECQVIDLASEPGGVDRRAAAALGISTVWALGLPGKTAPESAGEAIASVVLHILRERGDSA